MKFQDSNGTVVFILTSPAVIDSKDLQGILSTFRQVAEWEGDIATSVVHEPDMSPGSISTTIFRHLFDTCLIFFSVA